MLAMAINLGDAALACLLTRVAPPAAYIQLQPQAVSRCAGRQLLVVQEFSLIHLGTAGTARTCSLRDSAVPGDSR
eukprot:SAG31_NODE_6998_length_1824_cov_1.279420_1_plen_75_part_00